MTEIKINIKLLTDVNIEKYLVDQLKENRLDVKSILEINKRMTDSEVLELANTEGRILITNDKDFGEIVYRLKLIPNGIILLRYKELNVKEKAERLIDFLMNNKSNILNKFIVLSKEKIRSISL